MTEGLEKNLFGGAFTLLLAIMYMELRGMKDKIDLLEFKLEQHIEFQKDVSDYCNELKIRFGNDK
ncbi:MAG: hypothetical protein AB8G05_01340 [Oligoflexales bacterium]